MGDNLKFEALKSNNYYTWRQNMTAALVLKDLQHAVSQDAKYQALDATEKATMNAKAAALMKVKISGELKHLINGAADAKAAWEVLATTFKSQSVGRKAVLRQQLKELRRMLKRGEDQSVLT